MSTESQSDRLPLEGRLPPNRPTRFRLIRATLVVVVGFVAATGIMALIDGWSIASDLRFIRHTFAKLVPTGFSHPDSLLGAADEATVRLDRAERRASGSPWLALWSRVPFGGRPARWVRETAPAVAALGREASSALHRLAPRLEAPSSDGPARLSMLVSVRDEARALRMSLEGVRIAGPGWFVPPLNATHQSFMETLQRLRRAMADLEAAAAGVRSFLAGPSRYVVLAGNNAEMRSGGMVLQAGLLRAEKGAIAAGAFRPTGSLLLDQSVTLPAQLHSLYGWLDPGREWRNTTTSPNFPVVGGVYASMARAAGAGTVDGVLYVDVVALKHVLKVVGPVTVDGLRYDAANVERLVMHDLYVTEASDVAERRADLSRLAIETFRAVNRGGWRPGELLEALADAASGRHLLAWSQHPEQQEAWRRLGVEGSLERDGVILTIQNHAGNKLDWFLRPVASLSLQDRPGGWKRASIRLDLTNLTPAGEPSYILGGRFAPPGTYRGLIAVYLPGWSLNVEVDGADALVVGEDGPMRVIGVRVDVPLGGRHSVTVSFSIPPDEDRLVLLPSGRARPIPLRTPHGRVNDDRLRVIAV